MAITINVGTKRKIYSHPKNRINNTTMDFGTVQPTFKQFLQAGDSIQVQAKQFVRLAPMPLPTLADISVKNVVRFVPCTEVSPLYDNMVSSIPYNGYIPANDFCAKAYFARNCVLTHSSAYSVSSSGVITNTLEGSQRNEIFNKYGFWPYRLSSITPPSSLDGFDYYIEMDGFGIGFVFTDLSKRLRKIFLGLGYQLTDSSDYVSLTPIFAFYKAYFDEFYPKRYTNFNNTSLYKLINLSFGSTPIYTKDAFLKGFSSGPLVSGLSEVDKLVATFVQDELGQCFATQSMDLVSLCQQTTTVASSMTITSPQDELSPGEGFTESSTSENMMPTIDASVNRLSKVSLDLLRHLTHYVNKDTVIGKRLYKWLDAKFGSSVVSSIQAETRRVSDFISQINVGDVMSTSDTTGAGGEFLGSYAGQGKGGIGASFNFKAPQAGYIFVLSHIDVNNAYYQGVDPELLMIDKFSIPQQEFDSIGWELLPKMCIQPNNDLTSNVSVSQDGTFGYLPRYTMYKFSQDCINGDLSRRGTKASYSPYTINKDITGNVLDSNGHVSPWDIPTAGISWQFIGKYDYLTHYNRIFYVSDGTIDNFIVHTAFRVLHNNKLKSLSQSYDTICENDNATISTSAT